MIEDPLTGEVTLVGGTRDDRPNEFRDGPSLECPFCPGNEALTPPEIDRFGDERGWRVRAFLNKYPAIEPPHGSHEVIVDAATHATEISREAMRMWRRRYRAARLAFPSAWPVLFKNRGAYAGATLLHPHTQMIVVGRAPQRWRAMSERARAHQRQGGGCVWCDEVRAARDQGFVVAELPDAVALVRARARFGWALTIVPLECTPSLDRARDAAWEAVGALLEAGIGALLGNRGEACPFNVLVQSDPHAAGAAFHWHVELVPRFATLAGFELATGMFIRSASAQESAAQWRRMFTLPHGPL